MSEMSMAQYRAYLENLKAQVKPDHAEDEAAFEHQGEIQSVIDAIDMGVDVKRAAQSVGVRYLVRDERPLHERHNEDAVKERFEERGRE